MKRLFAISQPGNFLQPIQSKNMPEEKTICSCFSKINKSIIIDSEKGLSPKLDFVRKCTAAVCDLALEFRVNATVTSDGTGVESRCDQFAWVGAAIRDGVSTHGLFVNVTPDLEPFGLIEMPRPVSSLSMQKMSPVPMSKVRESLIRNLSGQFGYEDLHLYTRHPLLTRKAVEYA